MKLAGGYGVWKDEQGNTTGETALLSCCHCGGLVRLHDQHGNDRGLELGFCSLCKDKTCPRCAADPVCKPLEQRLREAEQRGRFLAAVDGGG